MKHTRNKGPAVYLFRRTKVSNIPTSTSKQFVKGCCIVLVTSFLSQVDHFGIFPLKMYLFLHAFLLIFFFAKIDWSELAKLIQKLRVGLTKSSTPLVANALSARARGKKTRADSVNGSCHSASSGKGKKNKIHITLYFTSADLKGNLNILVNHLNFPASLVRHASKLGSYTFNNSHEKNTSRAIHPLR